MTFSSANAGSLVRAVLDAVQLTADEQDVSADDFTAALALLDTTAQRNTEHERKALNDILIALRTLRANTTV